MQREPLSRCWGTVILHRGRPQPCSVSLSPFPGLTYRDPPSWPTAIMQREPLSRSRGTAIPKRGRPQPCSVSLSPIPRLPRGPLPRCPINRLHHRFHGHHLLSLNLSSAATAWSSTVVVRCHAAIAAIVAFQSLPCFRCVLHRGRLPPYSTGLSHVPGLTSGASSWQPYRSTAWASHLYPLGASSWLTAAIQQQRREREREREEW